MNLTTLPTFPCGLSKAPLTPNGFKDAKVHGLDVMASWPLVGVPTGETSGLAVLDVDPIGLPWLEDVPLPATRMHETRRGGFHLLFRHRPGLRCSAGKIAPGVDVRADGGYVVWWPWAGCGVTWPDKLADFPEWLVSACQRRERQDGSSADGSSADGSLVLLPASAQARTQIVSRQPTKNFAARWRWNYNRLSRVKAGEGRRAMLFEVSCEFGGMVIEGLIRPEAAVHMIVEACKHNGLLEECGRGELVRQIENGFRIVRERESDGNKESPSEER